MKTLEKDLSLMDFCTFKSTEIGGSLNWLVDFIFVV